MPNINVRFDDDPYDSLTMFCRANGVSIAAMVNALGDSVGGLDERRPPAWARDLVARARDIDYERRRRGGREPG